MAAAAICIITLETTTAIACFAPLPVWRASRNEVTGEAHRAGNSRRVARSAYTGAP